MATKFLLPSHHAFFTIFTKTRLITKPLLSKPSIIRFFCSVSLVENVIHGPSLYKGRNPSEFNNQPLFKSSPLAIDESKTDEKTIQTVINEDSFTRFFHILAIRVPSEECFAFENQLRCHLLNWPRIRNIARVPGDDVDHVFNKEKSVMEVETSDGRKRIGKDGTYGVEVVTDIDNEKDDMTGFLGDEFEERKWRGPTRLLLLDEQYAAKDVDALPEDIKALFKGGVKQNRRCTLVTCRLTLFYNYWQMNEILEELLPKGMVVPTAFETVGHIAHLNLKEEHLPYKQIIAQVVLDKNKPKIRTVVNKIDSIQNEYRTMQLELLAGNHSLVTTVIENGSRFHVDLAAVYWNSRLATERQRLVNHFTSSDIVCDVFSGVGPLAVAAAKKVKHVYANDLNPSAVECLEKNCVLNKLKRKITVFNMDGRRFIDSVFTSPKAISITQVVMNLPNDAAEFLDAFRGIYQGRSRYSDTAMPMIHVYGFSKAQDPEIDFHQRIKNALLEDLAEVEMHRVRVVAPGKWMLCASFVLPKRVAFAKEKLKTG